MVETPEVVEILPVAESLLRQLRARFPDTRLEARGIEPGDAVVVSGGVTSLHRILENLVLNACQGDGVRRARSVEVVVEAAPSVGSIAIRVQDDGPGFTPAQLAGRITGFETTKPGGSGLGLYTAERLARASGGSLTRENQPGGGAAINLYLRAGSVT
jgi:C4-dicarboxylate-specific signal transduction histidine kinase